MLALWALLAFSSCHGDPGETRDRTSANANGDRSAPRAAVETLGLEAIQQRIAARKGKVTVVNLWATWCQPCVAELPALARAAADFEDRGVLAYAVSLDLVNPMTEVDRNTLPGTLEQFASERTLALPVWLYDGDDDALAEWLGYGHVVPFTVVFDQDGRIVDRHEGESTYEQFASMIKAALES